MPKTAFSRALSAKQQELKLSATALAKTIGVGVQSVIAALKGASVPNAATAAKYAQFLGIEVEALKGMVGKGEAAPAKKAGKKAKAKAKAPRTGKAAAGDQRIDLTKITLGQVAALMSDDLAMAVYQAPAAKRDIIAAILRA